MRLKQMLKCHCIHHETPILVAGTSWWISCTQLFSTKTPGVSVLCRESHILVMKTDCFAFRVRMHEKVLITQQVLAGVT